MIPHSYIRSFAVAALALCTSTAIFAQSAQKQAAHSPTRLSASAAGTEVTPMSGGEVNAITLGATRMLIGKQLSAISLTTIRQKLKGTFESLTGGKTIQFASQISTESSIAGQNTLSVKLNFEARPVGGILTVRVELVPMFAGIGAASRPLASLEVAQAVEDIDESTVHQMVTDLSHKLGSQYASKGN